MNAFRKAVEARDLAALTALLAPDVEFWSPVSFSAYRGRDTVGFILAAVATVFEDFVYVDELERDGHSMLRFSARVGDRAAEGVDLIELDEQGRVARVVAAHDVGRAVNPALCEGQIQGAVHMGLGYALTEELECVDGMPTTFKLRDLGVLRARDMPEVEVILVEDPEPEGPMGAKGVGEIGLVPTAAAVAGALEAFDGVRRRTLPMRDSAAARAMSVGTRCS